MEILIPRIDKYKAYQLTPDFDIEDFQQFIINNGSEIHTFSKDNKINMVQFDWNPYGQDYAYHIELKLNQIFMYNEDDPEVFHIVKDIKDSWIILN